MKKRKLSNIENNNTSDIVNYNPNKKLKINHNEFENDQLGEFDNQFDPLNKVVQDKGKFVSIKTGPLEYSNEGNSSSALINSGVESSSNSAPISSVVEGSNSSAVIFSVVEDSRNSSTVITSVVGDSNNPTLITEVVEGNSTSSINSVAGDSNDTVLRSMHGVVNLADNNLPARYNYPKPTDYQDLISHYCDIWNKGLHRSESEIKVQLSDLRKRISDFISFLQDRVWDEDISIIEYYLDQANLGDELLRNTGLDSVIDDIDPSVVESETDSIVGNTQPFFGLEGTLPDIYINRDSSCVWDFLDYLTYFSQF